MKYHSPKHLCMLYHLLIFKSNFECDTNFLVSLNHFYSSFKQIDDESVIVEMYRDHVNKVDDLITNCCYIVKKNHYDIIEEVIEDLSRLHIETGSNNDNHLILNKIAKELNVDNINTWINKDYTVPSDIKESLIILYFMALGADGDINGNEIEKLIFCPTFMKCSAISEFDDERFEYIKSDINNMGGYESLDKYIEILCQKILNYDLFSTRKILREIFSILSLDGIENMEKKFFNKVASIFGLTQDEIDEFISNA